VEKARTLMASREHELAAEPPASEMTLWGDATRLQQVITNLLTNAARYTPKGGKIVFRTSQENGYAVFRVRDNGLGVPVDPGDHVRRKLKDLEGDIRPLQTSDGLEQQERE